MEDGESDGKVEKKVYAYEGTRADVHWHNDLCIHVGECGRADGDLFIGKRNPWCQPDLVAIEDVVDVVERCPTGALTIVRKDGGPEESAPAKNTVTVANHGPLYVTGDLHIDGAGDDMPGVRFRAALCRCGDSENKPFCDNTHETAGFRDHGAIGRTGPGLEAEGGALTIRCAPNGPLIVSGPVELVTASGRVAWRGEKLALCRCGASKAKPFCDGSHGPAGFEAD